MTDCENCQEMEYTRAKWTRYGGHMAKAKGEQVSLLVHCTSKPVFNCLNSQVCEAISWLVTLT